MEAGDLESRTVGGRTLYFFPEQRYGDKESKQAHAEVAADAYLKDFDEDAFFDDHGWTFECGSKD